MPNPDILIIDDDPLVREIASDILREEGYTVQIVPDAREAVAAIRAAMPKMVITDIMMPGTSGLDICKAVSADPALMHIKVMVMSAKPFEVEKRRAFMFGAVAFLQKPFDAKSFAKAVKNIMTDSV